MTDNVDKAERRGWGQEAIRAVKRLIIEAEEGIYTVERKTSNYAATDLGGYMEVGGKGKRRRGRKRMRGERRGDITGMGGEKRKRGVNYRSTSVELVTAEKRKVRGN